MDPARSAQMGERILKRAMVNMADADRDGKITTKEWKSFLSANSDDDGFLSLEKIAAGMGRRNRAGRGSRNSMIANMLTAAFDEDKDGKVSVKELEPCFARFDANKDGTLSGTERNASPSRRADLGAGNRGNRGVERRRHEAGVPVVGQEAPDFDLPFVADEKKSIKLSSFKGKKPVALIFGSYT